MDEFDARLERLQRYLVEQWACLSCDGKAFRSEEAERVADKHRWKANRDLLKNGNRLVI